MTPPTTDGPVLEADHVTRTFGDTVALRDVSLAVHPGELVGLLGPNGAGKTTLLSLVTGLRKPDSGTVRLFGGDPRNAASRVRLGTTPQETGLPPTLTVGEVVDFIAGHYPDPMPRGELLDRFGLGDLARRQTGALSGGQKRRLAVALAIVGRPRLVVLDEPTTGLDVEGRHTLWQALREYHASGATVVVTSHYLEEIEALAQRVVVIGGGTVLADDALAAVLARVQVRRVAFTLTEPDGTANTANTAGAESTESTAGVESAGSTPGTARVRGTAGVLDRLPGVVDASRDGDRVHVLAADADAFVRALVTSGTGFRGLEIRGASLEEAFLALTAESSGAGPHSATSSTPSSSTGSTFRSSTSRGSTASAPAPSEEMAR